MTGARAAWIALGSVAGLIAAVAVARWIWAVTLAGPVLYGEGAVAHAALLSRAGLEYASGAAAMDAPLRPIFTAANYPPLFFRIAGLGDPFVAGRIASVLATVAVAGAVAWRAWGAGRIPALTLAAAWVATFPVTVWGAALKPDVLALALTVGAVVAVGRSPRRAAVAGILLALAVWTKPTAALPAAALAVWCARQGRGTVVPFAAGAVAGALAPLAVMPLTADALRHVVTWNALPWSPEQAALLGVVAAAALGIVLVTLTVARAWRGPVGAYAVGALGVVALGGREGATVNYLLDLSAAAALAAAGALRHRALRMQPVPAAPLFATAVQLLLAFALLDPFGVMPGRPGTGAWGDGARIAAVRALPSGPVLVEDSGLLVAAGREPIVDDVFLWSRLHALARLAGPAFPEGPALLAAVSEGRFAAVVSEADLDQIGTAPAYERARWHPDLVRAVLDRYALDRRAGALWVYLPR